VCKVAAAAQPRHGGRAPAAAPHWPTARPRHRREACLAGRSPFPHIPPHAPLCLVVGGHCVHQLLGAAADAPGSTAHQVPRRVGLDEHARQRACRQGRRQLSAAAAASSAAGTQQGNLPQQMRARTRTPGPGAARCSAGMLAGLPEPGGAQVQGARPRSAAGPAPDSSNAWLYFSCLTRSKAMSMSSMPKASKSQQSCGQAVRGGGRGWAAGAAVGARRARPRGPASCKKPSPTCGRVQHTPPSAAAPTMRANRASYTAIVPILTTGRVANTGQARRWRAAR